MVDWLNARVDPRIHIYAQPTPNSVEAGVLEYVGWQNGREVTSAPFPEISFLGTKSLSPKLNHRTLCATMRLSLSKLNTICA